MLIDSHMTKKEEAFLWFDAHPFFVLLIKIKAKVYGISFIHACVFVYRGLK